ncbi:MAG: DUF2752 domain-containing protein [Acidobacteriota bacterium]|nr:MAG: DUF2752 domain-containing protein [Acidobacteriota bacterium]
MSDSRSAELTHARFPAPLTERRFGPLVLRWYPADHPTADLEPIGAIVGVIALLAQWPLPLELIAAQLDGCQFRTITGIPCLSCGITRGILALSGGAILTALRHNPLLIGLLVAGLAYTPLAAALWFWRRPRPRLGVTSTCARWALALVVVVLLIVNWVYLIFNDR